jgi:FkbM family methyltransferase
MAHGLKVIPAPLIAAPHHRSFTGTRNDVRLITLPELQSRKPTGNHPKSGWAGWMTVEPHDRESYVNLRRAYDEYFQNNVHDNDYLFFSNFERETGLFLDVGANIGFSAISFRNVNKSMKIISFEINPLLANVLGILKKEIMDFDFRMVGLSDKASTLSLYIPVCGTHLCTYLASTDMTNFELDYRLRDWNTETGESDFELLVIEVCTERCDDLGLSPTIIKVDTEGTEMTVINGMKDTIDRAKPIVMCEQNFHPELMDWFGRRSYKAFGYLWEKNELRDISNTSQNIIFIHMDRLPALAKQLTIR